MRYEAWLEYYAPLWREKFGVEMVVDPSGNGIDLVRTPLISLREERTESGLCLNALTGDKLSIGISRCSKAVTFLLGPGK